ncbi:MAG: hypothetical protein Q7J54_04330 [Candidatus Woesearchaeota archaeon]|nr:hypothetical protein [Candidatus Woesearchaeota archaeon]
MKVKMKKLYIWQAISAVLLISLIASLMPDKASGPSKEQAAKKAIDFINANMLQGQAAAVLKSVGEKNGLYTVSFSIGNQQYDSYVTKDGSLLFPSAIPLEAADQQQASSQTSSQSYPKTDKPKVELFVMSHCPYGVKAQEILVPVLRLLGESAEIKTRFVSYAMHGKIEIDDNSIEYCIQKEQESKYADYLACFVKSQKSDECIKSVGIDANNLNSCINLIDKQYSITALYNDQSTWLSGRYPQYPVDKELNQQYDVQGSETLIVNGVHVSAAEYRWDSDKLKAIICSAFNTAPAECSQNLGSSASPSSPSAGSCS